MGRFKSPGYAQRFLSACELIRQHFHPKPLGLSLGRKQHQLTAKDYRHQMCQRFESWRELTSLQAAAYLIPSSTSRGNWA